MVVQPEDPDELPLGVVGPAGKASFAVADALVGRYQVVDVSLERDDGDPGHSATSVRRAKYTESAQHHASRPGPEQQGP